MSYQSLIKVHERHDLIVLAVLVAMVVVAGAFMWVHPSITMLLIWAGLILAGVYWVIAARARRAERREARGSLKSNVCPQCGNALNRDTESGRWPCSQCGSIFLDSGDRMLGG